MRNVEEFCSSLDVPKLSRAPKVSIIIPCYNSGRYLLEAIESSTLQSYRDFEIIVVNDGSDDPLTLYVLKVLSDSGIVLIHSENKGVATARNVGIQKASGDLILPLDADDCLSKNFLENTVPVLESNPDVGVVFGQVYLFGESTGIWEQPDFSVKRILLDNMVVVSALFRRVDWLEIGGYRSSMIYGWEDWDFWLSMVELDRRFVKVPEEMLFYRIHKSSRDAKMKFIHKSLMYLSLVKNHKKLYARHPSTIVSLLKRFFDRNFEKSVCS